jgi:uncharacterized protein (DUF305 family)
MHQQATPHIDANGNVNKYFVAMMIPRHKSAVDMAENQISHGKNVQLNSLLKSNG